ncbi:dehydrogenase/reductase [Xylariaceae sp. FL1272]|nr:dehydrogenase/reductase [Xylariaceae sp. FL1272]
MTYKRTILITGGTINLGYHAAREIAKAQPDTLVVISSRSDKEKAADKINQSLGQKNTVYMPLDLSDLSNVRKFAENWAEKQYPPLQALLLNAGLQFPGDVQHTVDGIESTFGINHVGGALLFHLLCPFLAPDARIVLTSSGTHDHAQNSGLPDAIYNTAEELAHPTTETSQYKGRQRYATSKLCNVLWTYALARRLKEQGSQVTVTAFDPGLMPGTGLAREASGFERFLWMRVLPNIIPLLRFFLFANIHLPQASGANLARLAIEPELMGVSGKYFEGRREIRSSTDSYDISKQDDLWRWTVDYLAKGDEKERFERLR